MMMAMGMAMATVMAMAMGTVMAMEIDQCFRLWF